MSQSRTEERDQKVASCTFLDSSNLCLINTLTTACATAPRRVGVLNDTYLLQVAATSTAPVAGSPAAAVADSGRAPWRVWTPGTRERSPCAGRRVLLPWCTGLGELGSLGGHLPPQPPAPPRGAATLPLGSWAPPSNSEAPGSIGRLLLRDPE